MNKKILIIEDDKMLREMYEMKLKLAGLDIESAVDGEEGMEKMKKEKPAVVVTDLIMPKKNGFDVLEEMNKDDDLKNIPVVVLSNLGQDSDVDLAKKLGAKDYLIKANIQLEGLVNKVKEYLV